MDKWSSITQLSFLLPSVITVNRTAWQIDAAYTTAYEEDSMLERNIKYNTQMVLLFISSMWKMFHTVKQNLHCILLLDLLTSSGKTISRVLGFFLFFFWNKMHNTLIVSYTLESSAMTK